MRNITSNGHFCDTLEVFDGPQTNSEDGGDYETQRHPGKYLMIQGLKQVNCVEVANIGKAKTKRNETKINLLLSVTVNCRL